MYLFCLAETAQSPRLCWVYSERNSSSLQGLSTFHSNILKKDWMNWTNVKKFALTVSSVLCSAVSTVHNLKSPLLIIQIQILSLKLIP